MKTLCLLLLLALSSFAGERSAGEEMGVPVAVQYPLFLKVLTYDRELEARVGKELTIGIAFQPSLRASYVVKEELLALVKASPIQNVKGLPIKTVAIDLSETRDLAAVLRSREVDIVYVCPLRAYDIRTLTAAARARKAVTLTGVPEYVEAGLSVGVDIGAKGRPEILINHAASKAEGANFNAQLLRLARIVE